MSNIAASSNPGQAVAAWEKFSDDAQITSSSNKQGSPAFKELGLLGRLSAIFSFKSTIQQNAKKTLDQVRTSIKEAYPKLAESGHVDAHFEMFFHHPVHGLQGTVPTGKQLKSLKLCLDAQQEAASCKQLEKLKTDVKSLLENHGVTEGNVNSITPTNETIPTQGPRHNWGHNPVFQLQLKIDELLKNYPKSTADDAAATTYNKLREQMRSLNNDKLQHVFEVMQYPINRINGRRDPSNRTHPETYTAQNMPEWERKAFFGLVDSSVKAVRATLAENTSAASGFNNAADHYYKAVINDKTLRHDEYLYGSSGEFSHVKKLPEDQQKVNKTTVADNIEKGNKLMEQANSLLT